MPLPTGQPLYRICRLPRLAQTSMDLHLELMGIPAIADDIVCKIICPGSMLRWTASLPGPGTYDLY